MNVRLQRIAYFLFGTLFAMTPQAAAPALAVDLVYDGTSLSLRIVLEAYEWLLWRVEQAAAFYSGEGSHAVWLA